jgi:hypothetical protein
LGFKKFVPLAGIVKSYSNLFDHIGGRSGRRRRVLKLTDASKYPTKAPQRNQITCPSGNR